MDFDIISLLPEHLRPAALSIMQAVIVIAGLVAMAKPAIVNAIGEPTSNDSQGKKLIFGLLRVLDWVALQSPNVTSRKKLADTRQTLNAISSIPPRASKDSQ
jgi:hypothetical protein